MVQRVGTQTHTNREAASADARPGIAVTLPKKHKKQYKTIAFLYDFEFVLQYGPSETHTFVSRVQKTS